jgi:cytidyltransferase-like protein
MKYALYPGRFQPFHEGHAAIVQTLLDEGKTVYIGLRNTPKSESDPYSLKERARFIRRYFPDRERVKVMVLPDIGEIVYGRKVGYEIREVRLTPKLEEISATKIRHDNLDHRK